MVNKSSPEPNSTAVNDEPVLTEEELNRLATVFDVFIDVDFYLRYSKGTEQ